MKNISLFTIKSIISASFFILIFIVLCGIYLYVQDKKVGDKIYPNVTIDNVNFGMRTKADVENYFLKKNNNLKDLEVKLKYKDEQASFSGEMIKVGYDGKTLAQQAYLIGRSPHAPSSMYQKMKTIFNFGTFSFYSTMYVDPTPINEFLSSLEDKYNKPAENALFKYSEGRVTSFKIEKNGTRIDKEKAQQDLNNKIQQFAKNQNNRKIYITVESETIKPEITLESSNKFGISEEIGVGVSDYSGSIPGRVHNVILAASKFNGIIIPKGEEFSFNKIIGDISAASGYQQAYIISNGRTILGDGGGVCQVSTTLFRAALNTGLPIIERHAHAYRVHYYENDQKPGLDATIYTPSVDFRFKNDTPAAILIQTEVIEEENKLIFHFYGKKDNRKIELSDITILSQSPALPAVMQDDPTLKKGVTKQIDWAAPGAKTTFHYKVTHKDGRVTQDRDFLSVYRPWAAVFQVGTAE